MNTHDIETILRQYLTSDGYISADDIPAICNAIEADRKGRHLKECAQLEAEWASLKQMKEAYEADRQRRVEPVVWVVWGCQYPGKIPRLYGDRSIAELNCDRENGDQMLFLTGTPQPAEPVKGPSNADMAETRNVFIHIDVTKQTQMQNATDHNEWFRAVGYLSTWNMSFPTVEILANGERDMMAVYKDENNNLGYVIGAVWDGDHYGFHS